MRISSAVVRRRASPRKLHRSIRMQSTTSAAIRLRRAAPSVGLDAGQIPAPSEALRAGRQQLPRKLKERPSKAQRDDRIRRARLEDPFNGDTEALRAFVKARLLLHAERLGKDELLRRLRARGIEPPPLRDD